MHLRQWLHLSRNSRWWGLNWQELRTSVIMIRLLLWTRISERLSIIMILCWRTIWTKWHKLPLMNTRTTHLISTLYLILLSSEKLSQRYANDKESEFGKSNILTRRPLMRTISGRRNPNAMRNLRIETITLSWRTSKKTKRLDRMSTFIRMKTLSKNLRVSSQNWISRQMKKERTPRNRPWWMLSTKAKPQ